MHSNYTASSALSVSVYPLAASSQSQAPLIFPSSPDLKVPASVGRHYSLTMTTSHSKSYEGTICSQASLPRERVKSTPKGRTRESFPRV